MINRASVKACFTGCNIKAGKTTMQFELDQEDRFELPNLALLADGRKVQLEIAEEQQVLFVNGGTGECFDEEEDCDLGDEDPGDEAA